MITLFCIIIFLFIRTRCHKDNTPITANDLSIFLHTRPFPLYRHIVTLNDEGGADWNTFFQLSLLFSFAPSVAIFYFLICTTPDYNGKITLVYINIFQFYIIYSQIYYIY